MVDQALEEFIDEVDVKLADHCSREWHVEFESGTPGEVDHDTRQSLVQRHIAVAVTGQSLLVAPGPGQRLADGDANILDRVMGVDVQITSRLNVEVDQAMPRDLVEHVVEEGHAGGEIALAAAIEIETHGNLRLQGVTNDFCLAHELGPQKALGRGHDTISPSFRLSVKSP